MNSQNFLNQAQDSATISSLENAIIKAAEAYYSTGEPIMTDDQFDALVDNLRMICPTSPILSMADWGFKHPENKVKHIGENEMGSLDKVKYPEEVEGTYIVTPKLDGSSIECVFLNGVLKVASTRGDGSYGVDCTRHIQAILKRSCPALFDSEPNPPALLSIRGEVITSLAHKDLLDQRNIPSLRNFANGVINRKEASDDLSLLEFIPYHIRYNSDGVSYTKIEMLEKLESWGFSPILFAQVPGSSNILLSLYNGFKTTYPIDGLVLTYANKEMFGPDFTEYESSLYSTAYKFPSDNAQITVDFLRSSTGSTGRITTTIGTNNPILLSGAILGDSVTTHNYAYLRDNGIGVGSIVEITRSGEVIPYITKVIKSEGFVPITNCPVCGGIAQEDGAYLTCVNMSCPAIMRAGLDTFIDICGNPHGLGSTMMDSYYDEYRINKVAQLVVHIAGVTHLIGTSNRLLGLQATFGTHAGSLLNKMEVNIKTKLNAGISMKEFWLIINVRGLGEAMATKLSNIIPTDIVGLVKSGVNSNVATEIEKNIGTIISDYNHISCYTNVYCVKPTTIATQFKIAITGKTNIKRKDLEAMCAAKGVISGGVGKDTKYLVCNDPAAANSSKAKDAKANGTQIITEAELITILEGL